MNRWNRVAGNHDGWTTQLKWRRSGFTPTWHRLKFLLLIFTFKLCLRIVVLQIPLFWYFGSKADIYLPMRQSAGHCCALECFLVWEQTAFTHLLYLNTHSRYISITIFCHFIDLTLLTTLIHIFSLLNGRNLTAYKS